MPWRLHLIQWIVGFLLRLDSITKHKFYFSVAFYCLCVWCLCFLNTTFFKHIVHLPVNARRASHKSNCQRVNWHKTGIYHRVIIITVFNYWLNVCVPFTDSIRHSVISKPHHWPFCFSWYSGMLRMISRMFTSLLLMRTVNIPLAIGR